MKYVILKCVNGNYSVDSEGFTDVSTALVSFHGLCQALWNVPDVITATVMLADEKFYVVDGYREIISKAQPNADVE